MTDIDTYSHRKRIEEQGAQQNALIAANAVATMFQARETSKLRSAVSDLKKEITKQTEVQTKISNTLDLALDETKRQTYLLESANSRELLDRATKNAVFQIKVAIERLNEVQNPLEKFLGAQALFDSIESQSIDIRDLPEISDKEYFFGALKTLRSLSESSLKSLPDEELAELRLLSEAKENLERLEAGETLAAWYSAEAKKIRSIPDHEIMPKQATKRFFTLGKSALLIIGGALIGGTSQSVVEYASMLSVIGLVTMLLGMVMAIYRLLTGGTRAIKSVFDGSGKVRRALANEQRSALLKKVNNEFNAKCADIGLPTGIFEEKEFLDALAEAREKLKEKIRSRSSRFTTIDLTFG